MHCVYVLFIIPLAPGFGSRLRFVTESYNRNIPVEKYLISKYTCRYNIKYGKVRVVGYREARANLNIGIQNKTELLIYTTTQFSNK